jgi:hypothetical protein
MTKNRLPSVVMLDLMQHLVFILKISYPREEPRLEAPPGFLLLLHLNIGRVKFLCAGHDHPLDLA